MRALGRLWGGQCRESGKVDSEIGRCLCGYSDQNRSTVSDLNRHAQRSGLHGLPPAAFSPTAPPIRRPTSERFDGRWPVFTATFSQPKRTIRGARQALTCRPTLAQSTPTVVPPAALDQPPGKHAIRPAVVRARRPAVCKMNSMWGKIDRRGARGWERTRGRGEGAGNSGAAAGQIGQSDGVEKRQCSGVGPVWKRGGGIEMGQRGHR